MKWRIDFPNQGGVLSYVAYAPDYKLTTYYDPYDQCHRFMLEELVRIKSTGGSVSTRARLVRDTADKPAEGWTNADAAKKAAEDYHAEHVFCTPKRKQEAWR